MPNLYLKRNDTRPTLQIPLTEGTPAAPIDLTNALSVKLMMRTAEGAVVTRPATFVTPRTGGEILVTFVSTDTDESGEYIGEVEITWTDGGIETVPNDGWFTVTILDDLG